MQVLTRRFLLKALAAGVAAATHNFSLANTARTVPDSKVSGAFIVHNDLPWSLETRREAFGFGPITPASHLFVRNNLPMPPAEITDQGDDWTCTVAGCQREGQITLAELKRMKAQTVATVLQCSGNGREFFPHDPSGSQWGVGAAGCVLWTGVSVADIFEHFGGIQAEAAFLTTTGGEQLPEGIDTSSVVVERSVPISKGLQDCLVVWEMNGAPLPAIHGGPVRLIVPGYFGVNNVKWVRKLAATKSESSAKIQQAGYRMRPEGMSGSSDQPSMWRMPVKSWLNGPGSDGGSVLAGPNTLYGVAFSGERGVDFVEVSADDGVTWQRAEFVGPDLGANAWRTFQLVTDMPLGKNRFVCRATDTAGEQQPKLAVHNHRGYGHNGWQDHALTINAVAELPTLPNENIKYVGTADTPSNPIPPNTLVLTDQALQGKRLFNQGAQPGCGVCHSLADAKAQGVIGPNLNGLSPSFNQVVSAVSQGVGAMPAYGAQLSKQEIEALAAYVVEATR